MGQRYSERADLLFVLGKMSLITSGQVTYPLKILSCYQWNILELLSKTEANNFWFYNGLITGREVEEFQFSSISLKLEHTWNDF